MVRQQPFREIAREIERRIRQGVYPENSALPSRPELAEEFGVARATLDRAIQELTRSGILVSRHGSGTFAAPVAEKKFRVGVVSGAEFMEYAGSIFDAVFLNPAELENRSAWRRLFEFDGLLWVRPEAVLFPAIEAIAPQVPSVLINRVVAAGSRRIPKHCRYCCRVARIRWSPATGARVLWTPAAKRANSTKLCVCRLTLKRRSPRWKNA